MHGSADSPADHDEDHGETSCPPAACGGPQCSRDSPAACEGLYNCLKEAVIPGQGSAGAGSTKDSMESRGRVCRVLLLRREEWQMQFVKT